MKMGRDNDGQRQLQGQWNSSEMEIDNNEDSFNFGNEDDEQNEVIDNANNINEENENNNNKNEDSLNSSVRLPYYGFQKNRGLVLCFSQSRDRNGNETDLNNIKTTFEQHLGCLVIHFPDKSRQDITNILNLVKQVTNLLFDYLVIFVLAHGFRSSIDGHEYIKDCNNQKIPTELFIKFVRGGILRKFYGKPKLLFLQTCRTVDDEEHSIDKEVMQRNPFRSRVDSDSEGVYMYRSFRGRFATFSMGLRMVSNSRRNAVTVNQIERRRQSMVPLCEYMIIHSTVPDEYSFRHPQAGSLLIAELCNNLRQDPKAYLDEIIVNINQKWLSQMQSDGVFRQQLECVKCMSKFFRFQY